MSSGSWRGHTVIISDLLWLSRSPQYLHGKGMKGKMLPFAAEPAFLFCPWWKASHQNLLAGQQELTVDDWNVLQLQGDLGFYEAYQGPGESCHNSQGRKPLPCLCGDFLLQPTAHWWPLLSIFPAENQPAWPLGGPIAHRIQDWPSVLLAPLPATREVLKNLFPSLHVFLVKSNLGLFQPCL